MTIEIFLIPTTRNFLDGKVCFGHLSENSFKKNLTVTTVTVLVDSQFSAWLGSAIAKTFITEGRHIKNLNVSIP
jgi:hypothetical protein